MVDELTRTDFINRLAALVGPLQEKRPGFWQHRFLTPEEHEELHRLIRTRLTSGRWRWCLCRVCQRTHWSWAFPEERFTTLCSSCLQQPRGNFRYRILAEEEREEWSVDRPCPRGGGFE